MGQRIMFERFTERARQTVVLAQEEARAFKHSYIGTEHLLLSLIREEEGLAARVLSELGITQEKVTEQVKRIIGVGTQDINAQQIPFTPRAKKVYEWALREALSLGHNYIGTEHILLGLVRENEGVAARILRSEDVTPDAIRDEVIRVLSGPVHARLRVAREQRAAIEREKLWTPAKTEEENSREDGPTELVVRSVRGQVITISGDLTLEVDRDIYGVLNIQIKNPSGLPIQISEK